MANTMAGIIRRTLPAAATRLNPVNPATRRNRTTSGTPKGSEARHPTTHSARKTAKSQIQIISPGGSVDQGLGSHRSMVADK